MLKHYSELSPQEGLIAEQVMQQQAIERMHQVVDRATQILNDFDYCNDLILTLTESGEGDKIIWGILKAKSPEETLAWAKALQVAYAEVAMQVASSEYRS